MMRKSFLLAALLVAAPLSATAADGLSYTYAEAGWTQLKLNDDDLNDPKGTGGYVRGSYGIADNVNLFGGWSTVSKSYRFNGARLKYELNQPELGIGYHMAMTDRVDFTSDIAWLRLNQEVKLSVPGFGSARNKDHVNAGRVTVGLRGKPSPRTEAWIKGGYIDGSDMDGEWTGTLGGQINFTKTWGMTGEVQAYDGATQFSLGVRASF